MKWNNLRSKVSMLYLPGPDKHNPKEIMAAQAEKPSSIPVEINVKAVKYPNHRQEAMEIKRRKLPKRKATAAIHQTSAPNTGKEGWMKRGVHPKMTEKAMRTIKIENDRAGETRPFTPNKILRESRNFEFA
ncbi:MAG: hypothetical protein NC328_04675 [Muribaculum sp.]|nr:hypothetical protein [Muribaculum sp.]